MSISTLPPFHRLPGSTSTHRSRSASGSSSFLPFFDIAEAEDAFDYRAAIAYILANGLQPYGVIPPLSIRKRADAARSGDHPHPRTKAGSSTASAKRRKPQRQSGYLPGEGEAVDVSLASDKGKSRALDLPYPSFDDDSITARAAPTTLYSGKRTSRRPPAASRSRNTAVVDLGVPTYLAPTAFVSTAAWPSVGTSNVAVGRRCSSIPVKHESGRDGAPRGGQGQVQVQERTSNVAAGTRLPLPKLTVQTASDRDGRRFGAPLFPPEEGEEESWTQNGLDQGTPGDVPRALRRGNASLEVLLDDYDAGRASRLSPASSASSSQSSSSHSAASTAGSSSSLSVTSDVPGLSRSPTSPCLSTSPVSPPDGEGVFDASYFFPPIHSSSTDGAQAPVAPKKQLPSAPAAFPSVSPRASVPARREAVAQDAAPLVISSELEDELARPSPPVSLHSRSVSDPSPATPSDPSNPSDARIPSPAPPRRRPRGTRPSHASSFFLSPLYGLTPFARRIAQLARSTVPGLVNANRNSVERSAATSFEGHRGRLDDGNDDDDDDDETNSSSSEDASDAATAPFSATPSRGRVGSLRCRSASRARAAASVLLSFEGARGNDPETELCSVVCLQTFGLVGPTEPEDVVDDVSVESEKGRNEEEKEEPERVKRQGRGDGGEKDGDAVDRVSDDEAAEETKSVPSDALGSAPHPPSSRSAACGRGRGRDLGQKVIHASVSPPTSPPVSPPSSRESSPDRWVRLGTVVKRRRRTSSAERGGRRRAGRPSGAAAVGSATTRARSEAAGERKEQRDVGARESNVRPSSVGGSTYTPPPSLPAPPRVASPARPRLVSNSAHMLMFTLELNMIRANKLRAPLKCRYLLVRPPPSAPRAPASHAGSGSGSGSSPRSGRSGAGVKASAAGRKKSTAWVGKDGRRRAASPSPSPSPSAVECDGGGVGTRRGRESALRFEVTF